MIVQNEKSGRKRSWASYAVFGVSMLAGLGGVYYSRSYIETQIDQYKSANSEKPEDMLRVVVPGRDMLRGETVTRSDLLIREIPATYIDKNTVLEGNFENALGQTLAFDIKAGIALLWAHLEGGVSATFSGKVRAGLRAMTVRVDEINSISGFLQPRDRIDLLLVHGSSDESEIVPIIQKLDVIATGVQTEIDKQSGGKERQFSTVTVHVTPEQAKKISLALQVGRITAVLRNPEDDEALDEDPMTVANLLPQPEPVVARARVKRPAPVQPSIQYIVEGI